MGRVLDGIRLSGMLRSEIALVPRKKQLHIFLCFHQYQQQAAAKAELGKPFPQEAELQRKSARLAELNALLDMDAGRPAPQQEAARRLAKAERPSVLEKLKVSCVRGTPDRPHKKEMEVR